MATASDTQTATRSVARVDSLIWLTLMIAASIVVRLVVNTRFQAPTILTDELTYSNLARQIADGQFSLSNGYGVVYPLLLAPSWAIAKYGTDAYTYMKATNAVLVSLTAIPVFLWARRMMRHGYALLAAGLTLLMPSMAYSGHIMTENAFVLFVMIAVWAIAVAVERPTILNQALMLLALAAAFATRAQAAVLVVAVPVVIVLFVLVEERAGTPFRWSRCAHRLVRFWPLAAVATLGFAALAVRTAVSHRQWNDLLQAYGQTVNGQYTASGASRYFLWHLGEATFALGVIPVAALLGLVGFAALRRSGSTSERAYLATAVVVVPLVILQVATFMSYWAQRVSERNMFCVFPIVLIGLALWLDRGLPRSRRTTAVATAIAGVLALSAPFAYMYQRAPSTETWAVVLPDTLTRKLSGGADDVQILIVIGVATALFLFGIVRPRMAAVLIPLALAGFFCVGQAAAVHQVGKAARDYRNVPSLGADASWIDSAVPPDQQVGFLTGSVLGPDTDRVISWETQFFNKHPVTWIAWDSDLHSDPLTGAVTTASGAPPTLPRYVITPSTRQLAGTVLTNRGAYVLVEPTKPYAITLTAGGVYPDGWTGGTATLDVLSPSAQCTTATLDMSRPLNTGSTRVTVTVGELTTAADGTVALGPDPRVTGVDVQAGSSSTQAIDVPASPARIQIVSETPFEPASTGSPDTRQLGVLLRFSCGPLVLG